MKTRLHAILRGTFLALLASTVIQGQNATTPDDHGNTYTSATSTNLPGTKTGNLGTPGDIDYFKFTLNAPATVTVTSGGTTDVVGRLWLGASKVSPTEIYADNDSAGVPNFRLSQLLPAGTHYVSVNAAVYGALGNYSLNFAVAAPSAQQPDISVGMDGANLPSGALVNYGTVNLAQAVSRDFMLGNSGAADLSLYSVRIVPTTTLPTGVVNPFRLTALPIMTLQPGRQSFMRVTFQAGVPATYSSKVVITSNDGDETLYEIPLRAVAGGTPPAPEIAVRDGSTEVGNNGTLAVGSTMVNTRLLKLVTIANSGTGELRITSTSLVPVSTSGGTTATMAFAIYNSTVPSVIPAGGQASFQVSLLNLVAGNYAARLTLGTNDSNENPTVINFTGTVTPDPVQGEIAVSTSSTDVPTGSTVAYGNQFTGTNTAKDFIISNSGASELRITSWSLALPPPVTVSVATTTTTGSTTATVTSAANLAPGMAVSGPFPSGTTVVSIAGNAVIFSAAATSTVTNAIFSYFVGGTSATVQAFRVEGAVPTSIAAGGSATVRLSYLPLMAGDHAAIFRAYNNDADENPFVINLTGHADVNPNPGDIALSLSSGDVALNSTVDWGDAPVNAMTTKTFTITNAGTGDLRLTGFSCLPVQPAVSSTTPTYFLYGSIPSTTTPLAPGGSATFTMMFRPSVAGTLYKATMTIASTDPDEGIYKVNLQGTGAENTNPVPDIEISVNNAVVASGGTFAFGNSNSGALNQKSLTLRNVGASPLTISAIVTGLPVGSPNGAPNPWSVWALPITLAPGGSYGSFVNFAPTLAGSYTGVLQISSNDPDENPYLVNLTGTGVGTVAAPELNLALGGLELPMGGSMAYGDTAAGTPVSKTYTITNSGDAPLTLSFFSFELPLGSTVGATVTTTIGSTTATLGTTSAALVPGMTVSGPFPMNTTLVSIAGSTLTFSAPAITASTTSISFYQPGVPIANPFRYDGATPTSIAPGASANFTLTYAPLTAGSHTMVARFNSNDISESVYRFNVSGSATGTAPSPEVGVTVAGVNAPTGSTVAYGTTTPGAVVSKQYVISNTGTAALNLSGWSMINPAPAIYATGAATLGSSSMSLNSTINLTPGMVVAGGPFPVGTTLLTISGNTVTFSAQATSTTVSSSLTFFPAGTNTANYFQFSGTLPTSIAAGASSTITVNYSPTSSASGNHSMLMRFTNNDSDENPYQLLLTGSTNAPPPAPEIALSVAGTAVAQNGTIAYGSTTVGTPVSKQITIANTGGQVLNLSSYGFFLTATGTTVPSNTMMGSPMVTVASTTGLSAGMTVVGTGIPVGTTIAAINSATSLTLSASATSMLFNGIVTYYPAGTSTTNAFSISGTAPTSVAPGGTATLTVNYNPTAAGTHSIQLRFTTNDSDENPARVTLTGSATVSASGPEISVFIGTVEQARGSSIDFGSIARGTAATKDFIVKNTGTANLSVTNVISTLTPSGLTAPAFTVSLLSGGSSIAPGGSATFRATFRPMAKNTSYSATYNINNNDADENPYNFTLTGASNALDSEISVSFDGLDMPHNGSIAFGSGVNVGTSVSKSITISNSGDAPLTISTFGLSNSVTGGANVPPYAFGSLASNVAPGASATITVNYRPIVASTADNWVLTINNSDADEAAYKINLNASSVASTTPPEVALSVDGTDIASGGSLPLSTAVNVALTKDVVVRNTGTDPLIIASTFVNNTSGTAFSLTQGAPTSIPAGGTGIVKVRFLPTAAGSSFTGKITVNNSDPDETSYVINLTGSTTP